MKTPIGALCASLMGLACSTAPDLDHWVGLWTNRGDRHNLDAELSLSADGRFTLIEQVPAQTKPIPTVILGGTWSRADSRLRLHEEKEALVYGFMEPGRVNRMSISPMDLDLDLQLPPDTGTMYLPYRSDAKQDPIYQAVLRRIARTPKPIDWADLERQNREQPPAAAPEYRMLGRVDPRGKRPGSPPKS